MSSSYEATCQCGFKTHGMVGGLRSNYMQVSRFPFYCESDGLVDVNFREEPLKCPRCESVKIKPYGLPPISLPLKDGERDWPTIQAWNFQAYRDGNLCPKCKQMTLVFGNGMGLICD